MSGLSILAIIVVTILLAVIVILFTMGVLHGHLSNRGESFGAQVNTELDRRLRNIERKLDATLSADD